MQKNQQKTKRLVMNAGLIGIYIVLSYLTIPLGGLKITFEHFPVVLCAVLFGPLDAMLVGGIGELFNQVFSFGFTPTTLLWVLPIVIRGLLMGILAKIFKKQMGVAAICERRFPVVYTIVCVGTGLVASCFNTFAYYVDSKMFGYYNFALVFGSLLLRLFLSAVTSVLMSMMAKAVLHALRKERLI